MTLLLCFPSPDSDSTSKALGKRAWGYHIHAMKLIMITLGHSIGQLFVEINLLPLDEYDASLNSSLTRDSSRTFEAS